MESLTLVEKGRRSTQEFQHSSPVCFVDKTRPIFVVGCQRSGTTALAVMLDRHSGIAMLPETQFYHTYVQRDLANGGPQLHYRMIERALDDDFIRETGLTPDEVLDHYCESEATYDNLFRSILSAFVAKKGKRRAAEKSCHHLFHVEKLLSLYPDAKFICILRDGRDVVQSIRNVPWGRNRPVAGLCRAWNSFAKEMLRCQRRLSPRNFAVVRFADLMLRPEFTLRAICEFLGEAFEPGMLSESTASAAVPSVELGWKGKALGAPDSKRVGAWRHSVAKSEVARMNFYMGRMLERTGYTETQVRGASLLRRIRWMLAYVPFLPGIFPIAVIVNRCFWRLVGRPKPSLYHIPLK
jgi:hypothetical protein